MNGVTDLESLNSVHIMIEEKARPLLSDFWYFRVSQKGVPHIIYKNFSICFFKGHRPGMKARKAGAKRRSFWRTFHPWLPVKFRGNPKRRDHESFEEAKIYIDRVATDKDLKHAREAFDLREEGRTFV